MSSRRDRDPGEMPVQRAIKRYLQQRRAGGTADSTVRRATYQLKLFREWCESVGARSVGELRGFDVDDYYSIRAETLAPSTLENEMFLLEDFIEFLERREAVPDGLSEKVPKPTVSKDDRSSDIKLGAPEALSLLRHFRSTPDIYGRRMHAMFELMWVTGARLGAIRGLDLRDIHVDEAFVEYRHRPETDTPLKNDSGGERPVAVPPGTVDVLERYIGHHRHDKHDDHGRAPLLATIRGRPTTHTIRSWTYEATQPCHHSTCPHDRERESCEFVARDKASKCPSTRSPHRIRTGSIGWQLDIGLPPWVVAERVDATTDVIEEHYDKVSPRERMERRRRPFVDQMDIEEDDDNHDEN